MDRSPNVRIAPACGGNGEAKGGTDPIAQQPRVKLNQSRRARLLDSCPSINPVMTTSENDTQDTPLHGPNLILGVENFGPIAEAKNIEFKPMTVFVGPSNTGKTYLAVLLHTLLRSKPNSYLSGWESTRTNQRSAVAERPGDYGNLVDDIKKLFFSGSPRHLHQVAKFFIPFDDFSEATQRFIRDRTTRSFADYNDDANRNVSSMFGVEMISNLTRSERSPSHSMHLEFADVERNFRTDLIGKTNEIDLSDQDLWLWRELINDVRRNEFAESANDPMLAFDLSRVIEGFIHNQFRNMKDSFYFPAGRTAMFNNRFRIASEMLGEKPDRSRRPFDLLVNDFIRMLLLGAGSDLRDPMYETETKIATNFEAIMLPGKIVPLESPVWPEFEFEIGGIRIPIERASSMVTELASIPLTIGAHVNVGDLLIIDEPEAHLHPAAQQQMAAALAFMVRSGLRVLITTHSHYMVEQLSAFVNASKLDETTRKRTLSLGGALGKEDIYLNEEETAVYNFRFSSEHGGSVVEEVLMGDEYEYGTDDHSDATVDQFNRLQRVLEAREAAEANGVD